jgi:membrane protein
VPILALFFGIAKGFGLHENLRQNIMESASQNQEMFLYLFDFAEKTLENAKGGLVAGIGIIVLLYTILNTLSLIEDSFNAIWRVKQARTILRKFTDYLSMMLLAPFMLIFSSSITVFLSTNLK